MKLLYGTSNLAKLEHMRHMLQGLNIEIIGLNDVDINIEVDESGNHPLENAKIKAMAYYNASGMPTFSCDSGLYIEGLEDEMQPGVHVRRVNNRYLDDEAFIAYYSGLAGSLGEGRKAKYKNGICLVLDEKNVFQYDEDDIADHFILTSKVHNKRRPGFPMDSISLDIETNQYFVELEQGGVNERQITEGFRNFFKKTVL